MIYTDPDSRIEIWAAPKPRSLTIVSYPIFLILGNLRSLNFGSFRVSLNPILESGSVYWDPKPDLFVIPLIDWPIMWYGLLFALGFAIGFPIFKNILLRYFLQQPKREPEALLKQRALKITDKLTFYVIIATILGARLGHFLFYEDPSTYLRNPIELLRIREGGLASHGAAIAIIIALWIFSRWARKIESGLTWIRLMDFISVPTALVGFFIRVGNFVNQEILGTQTTLPWGVVFGHPADRSLPVPRHPVQLYEAFFYLFVFILLWRLTFRPTILLAQGHLFGYFLLLVFGFRFLIEFLKLEQSHLLARASELTMGQWLSIPFVILGALLIGWKRPHL